MRKMGLKTWGACALAGAALVLTAFTPTHAYAEGKQELNINWDDYTISAEPDGCPGHIIFGETEWNKVVVESGEHNIVLRDVKANLAHRKDLEGGRSPLVIESGATAHVTLEGSNELTGFVYGGRLNSCSPGIYVPEGARLTIDGSGSLISRGSSTGGAYGSAGIGGGEGDGFGTIEIKGGRIEAEGAGSGAGIGSGHHATYTEVGGTVIITGGYVVARGGSGDIGAATGAGIGCGENTGFTGTITINGGVVRAMGGDVDQASIGGGGSAGHNTGNGTFTTGENGNAVIAAPWGIGDTSNVANWDCILIDRDKNNQEGLQNIEYSIDGSGKETVKFVRGTPQVYGDVEADYNIVIDSPANLRVTSELDVDNNPATPNNLPSTFTMKAGTTLTNNNMASNPGIAGIALDPGSTLILEDGTSQCLGEGTLLATAATEKYGVGVVKLPLSDDMVSVSPASYVYDGTAKEPKETVAFNKWGYRQTFENDVDYTLTYQNNIEKGTARATATSIDNAGSKLLKTVDGKASTGSVTFEIAEGDFSVSTVARRYVQQGEDQLLSKLPTKPSFGVGNPEGVENGEFAWYSDKGCTTPLTNDFVAEKEVGAEIPVYWKYTQEGNANCVSSKTGTTTLVITDGKPPAVQVDSVVDDIVHDATYGDPAYTPEIKISLDEGKTWIVPTSEITYKVESQTAASQGDVVSVDGSSISIAGAGTATVTAHIDGYTDPDPDGDAGYGPAYVTITVNVSPAEISVDEESVQATDRAYNGTRAVEVSAKLAADGIVGNDGADGSIGVSATGKIDNRNAANNVPVTVSYELTGAKADDYELTNSPSTTVNITKAQAGEDTIQGKTGKLVIANGAEATYVFDLRVLAPDSKPVGDGEDGSLYPGRIHYRNPVVSISDNDYFTADDIRIDDVSSTMYLTVHDVDSTDEGELGTITFDMMCPNFEGMKGVIKVSRENAVIHTVKAIASEGGSITPSGAVEVVEGHDQAFTITADKGYEIADVIVDGESVGTVGTYTFKAVAGDHTIAASFKKVDEGDQGGDSDAGDEDGTGHGDQGSGNEGTGSGGVGDAGNFDADKGGSGAGTDAGRPSDGNDAQGSGDVLPVTGDTFSARAVGAVALVGCGLVALGIVKARRRS